MATKIHNVKQRSSEWHELRLGRFTASDLKSVLDMRTFKLKSKDVVLTAVSKLLAEIETGFSADSDYVSDAMEWGIDQEQEFKDEYLYKNGFEDIGFGTNDDFPLIGCSPDAIHKSGKTAVELKCPNSSNHIKFILKDEIPKEHLPQLYMYFIVFEDLERLVFTSYDSRNNVRPIHKKVIRRSEIAGELEKVKEVINEFTKLVDSFRV